MGSTFPAWAAMTTGRQQRGSGDCGCHCQGLCQLEWSVRGLLDGAALSLLPESRKAGDGTVH